MNSRFTRLCTTWAVSGLVVSAMAAAQEDQANVAAARELGIQGVRLADGGDCNGAMDRLVRAEQLHHAPTTAERLAECQIKLGKLVDGTEGLRRVIREVLPPSAPRAFFAAQERANALLAEARPKIAELKIAVAAPTDADFSVTIDGIPLPRANLNVNRPIDPGEHVVEATGP